jgi:phosphatidylglycerol:prolipoprotein diacylglycerol transferase
MLVVAFYTCYFLLSKDLRRLGYEDKLASDITFFAALGGIAGSKIYYLLESLDRVIEDPFGMIFSGSGLVFLGGLMGGTLGVTYVIRKNQLNWLTFGDIVAPLLILGYAIGRIGCFLVGDDYGLPTNMPWGMSFENGLPPTTYSVIERYYPWVDLTEFTEGLLKVHPTQLMETCIGLLFSFTLGKAYSHFSSRKSVFYVSYSCRCRNGFSWNLFALNSKYIFIFSGAQVISIIMIISGTYFLMNPFNGHVQETES